MNRVLAGFALSLAIVTAAPRAIAQTSLGESSGVNAALDRAPAAKDVLLELHQFDLFQQSASETAGNRGDDEVKKFALQLSNDAEKRSDDLVAIQKKAKFDFEWPDEASATRSNRLGGLSGSVAQVYVKAFYDVQVSEHRTALSLLQRYIAKADNDDVRAFAQKQLPRIEQGLKTAEAGLKSWTERNGNSARPYGSSSVSQ